MKETPNRGPCRLSRPALFWRPALLDAAVRGRHRSWTTPFEDAVVLGRLVRRRHCSKSPLFEGYMHLDEMILKTKSVALNHKWSNGVVKRNTLVRRLTLISHSPLICTLLKKWFWRLSGKKVVLQTYLCICKAFGHNPLISCDFGPNSKPRICKVHVSRGLAVKAIINFVLFWMLGTKWVKWNNSFGDVFGGW